MLSLEEFTFLFDHSSPAVQETVSRILEADLSPAELQAAFLCISPNGQRLLVGSRDNLAPM